MREICLLEDPQSVRDYLTADEDDHDVCFYAYKLVSYLLRLVERIFPKKTGISML